MDLVRDLAVILISAGIFAIISRTLKQPLVLGYIVAGFLIGPHMPMSVGISSNEAVSQWSEIGIIFLMFGLGLEFSFKKLLKAGTQSLSTAALKFIGCFTCGFIAGQAMGWTTMESIFLAGLSSMSSTMVVVKTFDDMKLKDKPFSGMVFGTLVVDDLIAILLLVLLSTMAASNRFSGTQLLLSFGKLGFFIILWFLVGIYLIPTLLEKSRKHMNSEILLIVSIGLCFGMVTIAQAVGFSSELGAFVMGSILAETVESEKIDKMVVPIKDLFGAIFFISVGMKLVPSAIVAHWQPIVILTLLTAVTAVCATMGVVITRGGLKNALYTGLSLSEVGEFGFIIVGVGVSLGVMREFIYPVIIAVSVITTFLTPYRIRLAEPLYRFLKRRLPRGLLEKIDDPDFSDNTGVAERSEWNKLIKAVSLRTLLYGVVLVAILVGAKLFLVPFMEKLLPELWTGLRKVVELSITLAVMAPFLHGLSMNSHSINSSVMKLISEKEGNKWPIMGLILGRSFIAISFVLMAISMWFVLKGWAVALVALACLVLFLLARLSIKKYSALEQRFLGNLNRREDLARRANPVRASIQDKMAGYDVHLERLSLSADSSLVGRKLKDLPLRADTGANIIKIKRGSSNIVIPSGDVTLYPHDELLAVGSTGQLALLKTKIEGSLCEHSQADPEFKVLAINLNEDSYLTGKSLRSTDMRASHCMVISVQRDGEMVTNPKPDFRFLSGDIVWVAGETDSLEWIGD